MILSSIAGAFALLSTGVAAAPSSSQFDSRADCSGKKFHSFDAPNCWDGVYDLSTNYYTQGPKSDPKTPRIYNFELTNITIAPDGVPRSVLAINGQIPGPTIFADWGDTVGMFCTYPSTVLPSGRLPPHSCECQKLSRLRRYRYSFPRNPPKPHYRTGRCRLHHSMPYSWRGPNADLHVGRYSVRHLLVSQPLCSSSMGRRVRRHCHQRSSVGAIP